MGGILDKSSFWLVQEESRENVDNKAAHHKWHHSGALTYLCGNYHCLYVPTSPTHKPLLSQELLIETTCNLQCKIKRRIGSDSWCSKDVHFSWLKAKHLYLYMHIVYAYVCERIPQDLLLLHTLYCQYRNGYKRKTLGWCIYLCLNSSMCTPL